MIPVTPLVIIWEDPDNDLRWNVIITPLISIWEDSENDPSYSTLL